MNRVFAWGDKALDSAAYGLKAATGALPFPRSTFWYDLLPRTKYDYKGDVGQGLQSTVVLGVVGWIMRNFTTATIGINQLLQVDGKIEKKAILPDVAGPGAMLRLLRYPNTFYTGSLLLKALICDYITTGNCYIWKRRSDGGRVIELWWLPKIYTKPIWPTDGSVYISKYRYNPNGTPFDIDPEDIVHIRDGLDPKNSREGLNRLAALAREIFTDEEASAFSATILTNMGAPSVIISPKQSQTNGPTTRISDPDSIKRAIKEKTSGDNRGEAIVLGSPAQVDVMTWDPQKLTLKELRRLPEERVSGVLGLPAILGGLGAGLDRNIYANYKEAREAGYEERIILDHAAFAEDFQMQLLAEFVADPLQYEVWWDYSNVRALAENQDALWTRAGAALGGGGITRRRFKELVGEAADEKDDVYYLPSNVMVVNADEVPPPVEADVPPEPAPVAPPALPPAPEDALSLPQIQPPVPARNGNGGAAVGA